MGRLFTTSTAYDVWTTVKDVTSSDVSISLIFQPDQTISAERSLFEIQVSAGNNRNIAFFYDTVLKAYRRFNGTWANNISSTTLTQNTIYQVVVTYANASGTNGRPKIYINGTESAYSSGANGGNTPDTLNHDWHFGNDINNSRHSGTIWEIGFWDRILTTGEIVALGNRWAPKCFPRNLIFYSSNNRSTLVNEVSGVNASSTGSSLTTHERVFYPTAFVTKQTIPSGGAVTLEASQALILSAGTPVLNGTFAVAASQAMVLDAGTPTLNGTFALAASQALVLNTTARLNPELRSTQALVLDAGTPPLTGTFAVAASQALVLDAGTPALNGTFALAAAQALVLDAGAPSLNGTFAVAASQALVLAVTADLTVETAVIQLAATPAMVLSAGTPALNGTFAVAASQALVLAPGANLDVILAASQALVLAPGAVLNGTFAVAASQALVLAVAADLVVSTGTAVLEATPALTLTATAYLHKTFRLYYTYDATTYDGNVLVDLPILYLPLIGKYGNSNYNSGNYIERDWTSRRDTAGFIVDSTHGQPITTRMPNHDWCAEFGFDTPQTYLEVLDADDISIANTGYLTIECWARPAAVGQTYVLGKLAASNYEYALSLSAGYTYNASGSANTSAAQPDAVAVGEWVHLAYVTTPSEVKMYKNGVLKNTTALSVTPANGTAKLKVGTHDGVTFFRGAIGKLAVYAHEVPAHALLRHYKEMVGF